MAIASKQPSMRASTLGSRLPDLPHPPPTLIEQPGFVELDREQRRWWNNVRTAIGDTGVDRDKQYSKLTKSVTVGDATLSAAITTETTLRVSADGALASQITTLTTNYQAADATLSASVTTETNARVSADSAEASTRSSADATLQTNINTVSASVTTETNARVSADSALASSITTVEANYQSADTTLQTNIGKKITVAGVAPGSPATNDLWVDTADNNKAKYWDGAAWQYKQDLILSASVTTEANARASADSALATNITTVQANLDKKIKVSATAPASPVLNDLWLDTTDNNKYKFWDGALWQYKQDLVLAASVTSEASARATADGFLAGKYTLTVAAGNVVTGMNITSSSGSGTNVSDVTFVAANFKIYNGTTGIVMFNVSVADVLLANTLTVSTAGKVYIGTGTYNNTNTAFFVDSAGQFSLKDKLAWNGTTLTINGGGTFSGALSAATGSFSGTVTAAAGAIGGFDLGADYIRDAANSFGLASTVTAGDDVRFWAGATFANRATAPFRLTEAGALVASNADITGTMKATAGYFGSGSGVVAIGSDGLTIGSSGRLITSGVTNVSTGTGIFLGYESGAYQFRVGNPSGANIRWNGSTLVITGASGGSSAPLIGSRNAGGASSGTAETSLGSIIVGVDGAQRTVYLIGNLFNPTPTSALITIILKANGTTIISQGYTPAVSHGDDIPFSLSATHTPTAGQCTYEVFIQSNNAGATGTTNGTTVSIY